MGYLLRDILTFVAIYATVLFLIPKRWLPADGSRAEWEVLVGVGVVTVLVVLRPELFGVVVLIWLGEILWHRVRGGARRQP